MHKEGEGASTDPLVSHDDNSIGGKFHRREEELETGQAGVLSNKNCTVGGGGSPSSMTDKGIETSHGRINQACGQRVEIVRWNNQHVRNEDAFLGTLYDAVRPPLHQ